MQKVEGSSPFIRSFRKPASAGLSSFLGAGLVVGVLAADAVQIDLVHRRAVLERLRLRRVSDRRAGAQPERRDQNGYQTAPHSLPPCSRGADVGSVHACALPDT